MVKTEPAFYLDWSESPWNFMFFLFIFIKFPGPWSPILYSNYEKFSNSIYLAINNLLCLSLISLSTLVNLNPPLSFLNGLNLLKFLERCAITLYSWTCLAADTLVEQFTSLLAILEFSSSILAFSFLLKSSCFTKTFKGVLFGVLSGELRNAEMSAGCWRSF